MSGHPCRSRPTPSARFGIVEQIERRNSGARVALRSALHAKELTFRLRRRIEGIAVDIMFVGARVVVPVDGCFSPGCRRHATYPKTNAAYWLPELKEINGRDLRQTTRLKVAGRMVLRVSERGCLPVGPKTSAPLARTCGRLFGELGTKGQCL